MFKKVKIMTAIILMLSFGSSIALASTVEDKRQDVRNLVNKILTSLYTTYPSAKGALQTAVAYAVFGNTGTKLGIISSAHGRGLAIDNANGKEYFMKMMEGGIGFGLGVSETSVIFVFESRESFNNFITNGWNFGGEANVAASDNVNGGTVLSGAVSVAPDVWVYQMTGKGLAASLTLNGTKYYIDKNLQQ